LVRELNYQITVNFLRKSNQFVARNCTDCNKGEKK